MVLPACLVRLIRRAKLPSSHLVRRAWLLPNTPRRVRPPPNQVGARYRLIHCSAAWWTALGCRRIRRAMQPLPARPPPMQVGSRARVLRQFFVQVLFYCSKMCFPASKQATQALLALVFEPFYHYCTVHFLLLEGVY